ncbi:hypothetical protein ACFQ3N_15175 [Virgibacillus byunsanensis]|uniref:Uncharacterized protein n=1 Tax=Virgibacillus byunsanensis TaxID=570945 RepID=A0ABW3LMW6_9BACI
MLTNIPTVMTPSGGKYILKFKNDQKPKIPAKKPKIISSWPKISWKWPKFSVQKPKLDTFLTPKLCAHLDYFYSVILFLILQL